MIFTCFLLIFCLPLEAKLLAIFVTCFLGFVLGGLQIVYGIFAFGSEIANETLNHKFGHGVLIILQAMQGG